MSIPGFAVLHLGRVVRESIRFALDGDGLTFRGYTVLLCLNGAEALSQREVADRIGLDRSDLVAVLDRLEGQGLVRRTIDPADRRRHLVAITESGKKVQQRGRRVVEAATTRALGHLTSAQQHDLHALAATALSTPASR